jgi:3-oxoadipate enol-lactonase
MVPPFLFCTASAAIEPSGKGSSRRAFAAWAWDARGYGDSDDYEGPLRFSVFSEDILRVLDFLKAPRAHIVGLSMGGRIARNFAIAHPERVAALVLANTSPGFDALTPAQVEDFVARRTHLDPADLAARLLGRDPPPAAREALLVSFARLHRESFLKTVRASVAEDRAAPLEKITAPTLVITSSEDRLYSPEIARAMARRIPHAELVEIEGAGHLSNLERPERFNDAILQFLGKQRR